MGIGEAGAALSDSEKEALGGWEAQHVCTRLWDAGRPHNTQEGREALTCVIYKGSHFILISFPPFPRLRLLEVEL